MTTFLIKLFYMLGLPVVCGGWNLENLGEAWISDYECAVTSERRLCEPGQYVLGSHMQVCCPYGSEDGCRVVGKACSAAEWNVCDAPTAHDEPMCLNDFGVYPGDPLCDSGDPLICIEGEFVGATLVCCTAEGACAIRDACEPGEGAFCSG